MKKIAILSMLIAGFLGDAIGATRPTGRTTARGGAESAPATQTTAARAATNSRTAPRAATSASSGAKTVNRGRAATTTKAPQRKRLLVQGPRLQVQQKT